MDLQKELSRVFSGRKGLIDMLAFTDKNILMSALIISVLAMTIFLSILLLAKISLLVLISIGNKKLSVIG